MKRAWLNNRRVGSNVRITDAYFRHQLFIRLIYKTPQYSIRNCWMAEVENYASQTLDDKKSRSDNIYNI